MRKKRMNKRIVLIAVSLLLMVPLIGSYASNGLISGCPAETTAGSSVSFSVNLDSGEKKDLSIAISPAADSLSVSEVSADSISRSGGSISATSLEGVTSLSFQASFSTAGTFTITANYGGSSDSCSVTVTESESESDGDKEEEQSPSNDQAKTDDKPKSGTQKPSGGQAKGVTGSSAASASSDNDNKTTYQGSADNYLESLKVAGQKFTQTFNKTNNTYFISTTDEIDNVIVKAVPTDSDATVVITGTENLSAGRNKIMVNVTAENGDVRVYRIYLDIC